jgi:hypothetical protein
VVEEEFGPVAPVEVHAVAAALGVADDEFGGCTPHRTELVDGVTDEDPELILYISRQILG